ncbi:MAG TPA: two-component regulator propeller domain-containing protein [Verrucomicrobiae bacterium]|nr:two-component regulator propeller domain-containing protein [Verrucomicrobiae bacterium]
MPDERVTALLQSRDGYLWIGTQSGVARFDGSRFTIYSRANTAQFDSDYCHTIVEDSEGNLWFGFRGGRRLVRKSGDQFKAFSPPGPHLSFDACKLLPSRSGGIWCGVDKMLYRIQGDHLEAYPAGDICGDPIPLREEEDGKLLIGGWQQSSRFDPIHHSFQRLPLLAGPQERSALAFCFGSGREGWLLSVDSSSSGCPITAKGHITFLKDGRLPEILNADGDGFVLNSRARFVIRDSCGALWLPGNGRGIIRFFEGRYEVLPMPRLAEEEFPMCCIADREGSIWIGSDYSGLQRWTPRKVKTYGAEEGLLHNQVWTVLEARDGSIWIGTEAGLSHWEDGHFSNFRFGNEPPANAVRSVVQDRGGTIWVGTIRLLESIRDGMLSEHRLPGPWEETKIRCLLAARDGTLWVGTARGLSRLTNNVPTKFRDPSGPGECDVRAMLEDRNGDVWVGTAGSGLYRFHDGEFSLLTTTHGLSSQNIWALYQDSDGSLWIGADNGLNLLKDGHFTTFTVRQGLPANGVDSILEDDYGRIWVSHDKGLFRVAKSQFLEVAARHKESVEAVSYDQTDGLSTMEFNGQKSNPTACKTRDGRLWFPTVKGVVVIDPKMTALDETPPMTVIEQFRANGKLLVDRSEHLGSAAAKPVLNCRSGPLKLPPGGAKVLEFRYVSPTLLAPEKVRFRFRLIGLSDEWIEADDRREAYFTDLRPGNYTFEVIACNHHGIWQPHGANVAFTVGAHIYESSMFYATLGLGVITASLTLVGWRVRELRKIYRLKQHKALAEQRERFARDVHDEVGASLNQIVCLSESGNGASVAAESNANRLQHIRAVADATLSNIGQIVWATNPKFDTLFDLVGYLREFCATYFEHTGTRVDFDFPGDVPAQKLPGQFRRELILIAKEALQNVVKHAAATEVRVGLALLPGRMELSIMDNGRGLLQKEANSKGNGISNMRNRVAALGGSLRIKPRPGGGTLVAICVPFSINGNG